MSDRRAIVWTPYRVKLLLDLHGQYDLQDIAERLCVSRNALNKKVQELRKQGKLLIPK